ncbi:transcriptional regulator, TetR family [Microbispora rosea]|uniref:Transcriptional regulator, TetR family n=1 Tax=Microbispora rosea TaxID=58117 RepID=A0A1N7DUR8_9ACTN|nr:TetR family transcriptional regulator [Microbispora rosea]GIH49172.1 TetR family transcriptional regulator [Microbispora rosea subsp. rosea]SIR79521.1 transcriptional regulator, TetR family [Microbispora rosea]
MTQPKPNDPDADPSPQPARTPNDPDADPSPQPTRRRAPSMSPEARRAMIVHVTLPLVAEYGAAVKTSQIAAAAGIGEATIFRVFKDKDELLEACIAEALRPDNVVEAIRAIPLEISLHERLHEAAAAMEAHMDRMGRVLGAMHASGFRSGPRNRSDASGQPHQRDDASGQPHQRDDASGQPRERGGRVAGIAATRAALAELFAPEQPALRLPADQLAGVLLDLLFARSRRPDAGSEPICVASLIELFLHGAFDQAKPPAEFQGGA